LPPPPTAGLGQFFVQGAAAALIGASAIAAIPKAMLSFTLAPQRRQNVDR